MSLPATIASYSQPQAYQMDFSARSLLPEIFRHIVHSSDPRTARAIKSTNVFLNQFVTNYDLLLAEQRWRIATGSLRSCLFWAAGAGHATVVSRLVKCSACLTADRFTEDDLYEALCCASRGGHKEVILSLIEAGGKVQLDGKPTTPLHHAAIHGHSEVIAFILQTTCLRPDGTNDGHMSPLGWAARNGRNAVVSVLLSLGADVAYEDVDGQTPLAWAADGGRTTCVSLILEAGGDVNGGQNVDANPLSLAAQKGRDDVVTVLLAGGALVDWRDSWDMTPLMWASRYAHEGVVKQLIRAGANANLRDNKDHSALSWAASFNHFRIVKMLLEAGAEPHVRDRMGRTPLEIAEVHGYNEIVSLLRSR